MENIIQLYLCQTEVKTLVVVHKEFLVNRWKERIKQFLQMQNWKNTK